MKIMITNSPLHFSHGHTFIQPDWQTLILPYLAGIMGDKHEYKIVDNMRGSLFKSNQIERMVDAFQPEILCVSIIASRDIFNTLDVLKKVRSRYPQLKIIAGGQAGTYYYKWLHQVGVDFVVHGEGEKTLKELIGALEEGIKDFSDIKGISYPTKKGIHKTPEQERIKNLDDGPFPRWDLMPKVKSIYFPGRHVSSVEMSRGCPFSCNFCAISAFWKSFRQKSNERILEELRILKDRGRTHIYLADDNFGMNEKKHIELFKQMVAEKLDIKFFAQIRPDTIAKHPKMMRWAAKAGMYGALIGFDTYNKKTFDNVNKTTTTDLNDECSRVLRDNGISIFGCHIYGLPDQKKPKDFEVTFRKGRENSDLFTMPFFSPLPFTKGYEDLVGINPLEKSYEEVRDHPDDFRPRFGNEEHRKRMQKEYPRYYRKHQFSLSEIYGALAHPNPVIRQFKIGGFRKYFAYHTYKFLRKLGVSDI